MNRIKTRTAAGLGVAVVIVGFATLLAPSAAFAAEDDCAGLVRAGSDQTVVALAGGQLTKASPSNATNDESDPIVRGQHYQASEVFQCLGVAMRRISIEGHSIDRFILDSALKPFDPLAGVTFGSWIALAPGLESVNVMSRPADTDGIHEELTPGKAYVASSDPIPGEPSMRHSDGYYALKFDDGVIGFVSADEVQKVTKDYKPSPTSDTTTRPSEPTSTPPQTAASAQSDSDAPAFLPGLIIGLAAAAGAIALFLKRRRKKATTTTPEKDPSA